MLDVFNKAARLKTGKGGLVGVFVLFAPDCDVCHFAVYAHLIPGGESKEQELMSLASVIQFSNGQKLFHVDVIVTVQVSDTTEARSRNFRRSHNN
jgi:hypothetical protein